MLCSVTLFNSLHVDVKSRRHRHFVQKIVKKLKMVKYHVYIWNHHGNSIKMSTNKPMFGIVVLEIPCGIWIKKIIFFIQTCGYRARRALLVMVYEPQSTMHALQFDIHRGFLVFGQTHLTKFARQDKKLTSGCAIIDNNVDLFQLMRGSCKCVQKEPAVSWTIVP